MLSETHFTKENLDQYLKELAKEFRKLNGKQTPAEIILIGGASVLVNYGFREKTYDIDAIIQASSAMQDAIANVGERLHLERGWINTDFMKTTSYTPNLVQYSRYYKTFSNILQIRTISAEYLVAMKLMSYREYKNDKSDIVGVLLEQKKLGKEVTLESIKRAVIELYGKISVLSDEAIKFLDNVFDASDLETLYNETRLNEIKNKERLVKFQEEYPDTLNGDDLMDILNSLERKEKKEEDKLKDLSLF